MKRLGWHGAIERFKFKYGPRAAEQVQRPVQRRQGRVELSAMHEDGAAHVAEHLVGRASDQLASVAARLREMRTAALETGKAAAHVTDDYVHESPWLAIASAACVGVVIGLLISRR